MLGLMHCGMVHTLRLQVANVKRQASKALKHMRQQMLTALQQREELQKQVRPDSQCAP